MAYKKIIACLDIKDGRVVKGINFVGFKDAGEPAEIAAAYSRQGADEIVFLDISATVEGRGTMLKVIEKAAAKVTVPLTVGGGIRTVSDIEKVLKCGAQKISINTAAFENPDLIRQAAEKFGKQSIVIAIDTKKIDGQYVVMLSGGARPTKTSVVEWAKQVESLGAGEILLTSMDADGTKDGYDLEITRAVSSSVKIPVTASGGAGKPEDFYLAFTEGGASAALAASLFHFGEVEIPKLKEYLKSKNVQIKV